MCFGGSKPPPHFHIHDDDSDSDNSLRFQHNIQWKTIRSKPDRQWHERLYPMHSSHIHLPTEIVVLIVSFAACDADDARRQRSMYACCLLSTQWYSAAIAFLYERPRLDRGLSFKKFTDTVCPPIAARKNKLNLGSLVRRLDLSGLVHHSSNSLTARLLGRVRANLEVFIAPSVSFA